VTLLHVSESEGANWFQTKAVVRAVGREGYLHAFGVLRPVESGKDAVKGGGRNPKELRVKFKIQTAVGEGCGCGFFRLAGKLPPCMKFDAELSQPRILNSTTPTPTCTLGIFPDF